jgi:hypothetical protein
MQFGRVIRRLLAVVSMTVGLFIAAQAPAMAAPPSQNSGVSSSSPAPGSGVVTPADWWW